MSSESHPGSLPSPSPDPRQVPAEEPERPFGLAHESANQENPSDQGDRAEQGDRTGQGCRTAPALPSGGTYTQKPAEAGEPADSVGGAVLAGSAEPADSAPPAGAACKAQLARPSQSTADASAEVRSNQPEETIHRDSSFGLAACGEEVEHSAMPQAAAPAQATAEPAPDFVPDPAAAGNAKVRGRRWLSALFVLVLAVRAVVPFVAHDGLKHRDPDAYWRLAKNLWVYDTFGSEYVPTAYRPPLYPLLLAPAAELGNRAWLAIAGLHAILGLVTVLLTWDLARDLAPEAAWLAALLVAWDPLLVRWSAEIMTETLAAFLAVLFWIWCQQAGRGALAALVTGLVAGMAALTRPTFLPMLPAAALLAAFTAPSRARGLLYGVLLLIGGMMLLGPWWVRNERVFHRFIPATTHGGYTLYLGNNPFLYYYQASLLVNPDLSLFERYLYYPPREPSYRRGRPHREFCTSLTEE